MLSSSFNLFLLCTLVSIVFSGNLDQHALRGIPPTLLLKYAPSKQFSCLDGSMKVPFEYVNDDYCDCPDGSDEPGTSACPNGKFYCENKGYVGATIPSHFVGDGVCDCCDGSDEYERSVVCNNTCFELAQKTRAEREAKRLLHETGVAKKKDIILNAVALKAERQARLEELEQEVSTVEAELKAKEEIKQQAEIPESEAKEKHRKLVEQKRAEREAIEHDKHMREIFADLDTNHDSLVSIEEIQKHTELDNDRENEFTAEEARTILGADAVNLEDFNTTVFEQISNTYQKSSDNKPTEETIKIPSPPDTETTTTPDDHHDVGGDYDEDEHSDGSDSSVPTSIEHEKHIHDDIPLEYDEEAKKLIEAADRARNDYYDVDRRLNDIRRKRDDLKRQSEVDVGAHGEYSAFIDQCFDFDEREYTYRICMFKDVKQIPKGGGSEVTVGHWDSWSGPENNKYLKMRYGNGVTCWNGPARSMTVTLQCGVDNRAIDVREPTRCEYTMLFETPSACDETIAATLDHHQHEEF